MKTAIKILKYIGIAIVGFFALILLWFSFWNLYEEGENQRIILPNNYQGGVIVLCNEKDGVSKNYINGERVYEIPKNGVLKTKFNFQNGKRYKIRYFYKSGRELRYLWPSDRVWEDTINVNSVYKDSIYAFRLSYADDFWFIIGKPKDIGNLFKKLDEMWKPLSKTIILKEGDSYGKVIENATLKTAPAPARIFSGGK